MSADQFKATKAVVAEFGKEGGQGEELQRRLVERAETRDSWVSEDHSSYQQSYMCKCPSILEIHLS